MTEDLIERGRTSQDKSANTSAKQVPSVTNIGSVGSSIQIFGATH